MTTETKCDRCGQVDCPTTDRSKRTYDVLRDRDWTAAFQACATMGIRMELKLLRPDVVNLLRHAVSR